MARSSNAVLRAAAILDFVAEHPGESFSMAELVRALKLSHSTCHSLVSALVDVNYLHRTTDKLYALGPRLAAIARISQERSSLLQIAKRELRQLAAKLDLVCSALVREESMSVVRERSTSARHVRYTTQIGMPLRLRAPLASAFFVASPQGAEEWLALAGDLDVEAERDALEQGIAFLRTHGFLALVNNADGPPPSTPLAQLFDGAVSELPVIAAHTIARDSEYAVSSIVTPVFNADSDVEFVLSLIGYDNPISGARLLDYAEELQAAATRISASVIDGSERARLLPL